jgi:hypothetical protein
VILERRLIDVRDELVLVLAVRLYRVQMFGTLGERGIKDVLAGVRAGYGLFPPGAAASCQQHESARARRKKTEIIDEVYGTPL